MPGALSCADHFLQLEIAFLGPRRVPECYLHKQVKLGEGDDHAQRKLLDRVKKRKGLSALDYGEFSLVQTEMTPVSRSSRGILNAFDLCVSIQRTVIFSAVSQITSADLF